MTYQIGVKVVRLDQILLGPQARCVFREMDTNQGNANPFRRIQPFATEWRRMSSFSQIS